MYICTIRFCTSVIIHPVNKPDSLRVNSGGNRSLGDTNMRLGNNDPHIPLIEKKVGARTKSTKMTIKSKMATTKNC